MNGDEVNLLMNPESRASLDENKTIDQLLIKLNVFDVAFHNLEALQVPVDVINGDNFQFVPFPCGAFVDLITEAFFISGQDRSKKFLDIGCGIGTKVILACSYFDAYGIDYNSDYVDKSKVWGLNRVSLVDALVFDKYNQFDCLYYYRPLFNPEMYYEFEEKIHKDMKSGSIVAPMASRYDWDNQVDVKRLTKYWYGKK